MAFYQNTAAMLSHQNTAVLQLFKSLKGVWKLYRRWDMQGHMQGMASFQTQGKRVLYYQEQGKATFNNSRTVPAHRAYAYVYVQGTIAVYFGNREQRRPAGLLHTLQFYNVKTINQPLVAIGTHVCGEDVYRACYTFVNDQHFQLTYQVQGPRKSYIIQTHFDKVIDTALSP